jgi:flavodoxin
VNATVVYYTRFGNTKQVAEAIAEVLAGAGEARVLSIDELAAADLQDADLVVFGSPTHYQNLPKAVRAALDALPRRALRGGPRSRGKRVAAYDTSVKAWGPLMWMTAAHRLLPRLRRLGGKPITRPETFLVVRGEDPQSGERRDALVEGELERARAWAASILERVGAG